MPKEDPKKILEGQKKRFNLSLIVTEDCNLRCRYCYEPTKTRDRYMSLERAQEIITYYMETAEEFDEIEIDFFGGEPMLAFDLIRDVVEWFHAREWPKDHLFFISTNGTILTEEMKAWLIQYDCVKVNVSLDGNKTAHDLNRSNSYDQVMRNLPFFVKHWPDQPLKMTISAETIPYVADSIIELEEMGLQFSANVVFEDTWGAPEQKAALLETYAQQLARLVEYYAAHSDLFPARIVDVSLEYMTEESPGTESDDKNNVRWCGAGIEMVTVDIGGNRYPCHRFSPWITGKPAPTELVNRQQAWQSQQCAECQLLKLCPICIGYNWEVHGDPSIRTTYHCEAFKLEVQASAKLQALRLLQQQPEDLASLPPEEAYQVKRRLDAILELAANGV